MVRSRLMLFESPPTYNDPDCEFTTDFESVSGPGFFPVHSGRIVADDLSQHAAVRIAFFGTDWGWKCRAQACHQKVAAGYECACQRSLHRKENGQPRPYLTERNLFDALTEVKSLDLKTVVLTNAVLGLSTEDQTGNDRVFTKHRKYLCDCAAYHCRWLDRQKPRLVVLMGTAHLKAYRRIWERVWPELFGSGPPKGVWHGLELGAAFRRGLTVAAAKSGLHVQLAYHPSSGPWWETRRRKMVETWRKFA